MEKNKHHIFTHAGEPKTLCGINDRDGIVFNTGKNVNCKRCLKMRKCTSRVAAAFTIVQSKDNKKYKNF